MMQESDTLVDLRYHYARGWFVCSDRGPETVSVVQMALAHVVEHRLKGVPWSIAIVLLFPSETLTA
jgi:hypothetical protein